MEFIKKNIGVSIDVEFWTVSGEFYKYICRYVLMYKYKDSGWLSSRDTILKQANVQYDCQIVSGDYRFENGFRVYIHTDPQPAKGYVLGLIN